MKTRLGQDRLLVMNSSDLNDEQELRSDLDEFLLARILITISTNQVRRTS